MQKIISTLEDHKFYNIISYSVKENTFFDFAIIATGSSTAHIDGTSQKIIAQLKKNNMNFEISKSTNQQWTMFYFNYTQLHLFTDFSRMKYNIDTLFTNDRL